MNRNPVKSSNVKSIGHDPASNTLEVEFNSGQIHQYSDVPADKHMQLISAKSIGSFFQSQIRGKHNSLKLK